MTDRDTAAEEGRLGDLRVQQAQKAIRDVVRGSGLPGHLTLALRASEMLAEQAAEIERLKAELARAERAWDWHADLLAALDGDAEAGEDGAHG